MKLTKKQLNQNICITDGNMKLTDNGKQYFLIFSIPAIATCPNATALCKESCYAMKAQRQYPNVRTSRAKNYQESLTDTFVGDVNQVIQWNINRPSKKGKQVFFRIHESGDFYSKEYFMDWVEIALDNPDITFLAYTKSINIVADYTGPIPDNLVIRYSVWDDTKPEDKALAETLSLPIYTAYNEVTVERKVATEGFSKCKGDCHDCKICYSNKVDKIACVIH